MHREMENPGGVDERRRFLEAFFLCSTAEMETARTLARYYRGWADPTT
jgi:hypothetical protein